MISRLLAATLLLALVVVVGLLSTTTTATSTTSASTDPPRPESTAIDLATGAPIAAAKPTKSSPDGAHLSNDADEIHLAAAANLNENSHKDHNLKRRHQLQQHPKKVYTNQFVIEVKGGEIEARKLAEKHGFIYLNHILGDYYHLEHHRLAKRSIDASDMSQLELSIEDEPQVIKLERQVLKKRVKRDYLELANNPSAQHQHPVVPNNNNNQRLLSVQHLHQQQQQLLRPTGSSQATASSSRPAHHQFTRPANQLPGQGLQLNVNYNANNFNPSSSPPVTLNQNQRRPSSFAGSPRTFSSETLDSMSSNPSPNFAQPPTVLSKRPPPPPITTTFHLATGNGSNWASSSSGDAAAKLLHKQHAALSQNSTTLRPVPFNDPSWALMWYLDGGARNGFDLNVQAAWRMGYTGKGIVITILDDGLEKDHPDLQANYDPLASFDINGDDADPMPRYDPNDSNRHGTRCAGEVAAVPGNNVCSIGIAYNSKVGGVRMLDGDVTDAVEARSLGLNNQHIHIYSASWGPDDNGKTVDGPGELATRAFIEGVTNGRQGLGSIFVFASGNGGREHDNCNCDGYTNSIWTLSISSATENGFVPWYIEACSSTLATTYSSGAYDERQIATTDIRHSCTSNHTGTSASAPLAAGICALVLESNPQLTWRDMQHIVVRTSRPANLIAKDWRTNAMGRNVSHAFGYGLMDAAAMITMAKQWTSVPQQYTCEVRAPQLDKMIPSKGHIELKIRAECSNVRYLEHVQSKVTLTASRRGDLHIYLVSPRGTRSTLLAQRPNDQAEQGFRNWPFMTVHNWGEPPNGNWTLQVHNDGKPQNRAFIKEWTLILYGTYDDPNKHLDPISLANSVPIAATPAPPMQQQQQQQQSRNNNINTNYKLNASYSSNRQPGSGSGQFGSVPTAAGSGHVPSPQGADQIESVVAQKKPQLPVNLNANNGNSHSASGFAPSASGPPPPLPPIGSQISANSRVTSSQSNPVTTITSTTTSTSSSVSESGRSGASQQPDGSTTTTATATTTPSASSYLNNFKTTTTVNTIPANYEHGTSTTGQTHATDTSNRFSGSGSVGGNSNQADGTLSGKTDFEIVAAPNNNGNNHDPNNNNHWQTDLPLITTLMPINDNSSSSFGADLTGDNFSVITSKPSHPMLEADQFEGNKIEQMPTTITTTTTTSRPLSTNDQAIGSSNNKNINHLGQQQADEQLDANQLDQLKQTKDLRRGKGGQQMPTSVIDPNNNNNNHQQMLQNGQSTSFDSSDTNAGYSQTISGDNTNNNNNHIRHHNEPSSAQASANLQLVTTTTTNHYHQLFKFKWPSIHLVVAIFITFVTTATNPIVRIRQT